MLNTDELKAHDLGSLSIKKLTPNKPTEVFITSHELRSFREAKKK